MAVREDLKAAYSLRSSVDELITEYTKTYIDQLGDDERGLYITDHAMVRYLERVKGYILRGDTDEEKLSHYNSSLTKLRNEMLTVAEDRRILTMRKSANKIRDYIYIVKNLAVVTVISI